jgi:hypothetical protein
MSKKILKTPGRRAPSDGLTLLLFAGITFLLFYPVLHNGFLTDDYASLYRISVEKRVLYRDILRPLIDISFYLNYRISGLHPEGYYLFNMSVHALSAFMTCKVAMGIRLFEDRRQDVWAWVAGLLFLVYPFHNESIVWLSGRLSSMAALCGLLAIYCSQRGKWPLNFLLSALFLVVGLFAYESIIMIPLIIMVLNWPSYSNKKMLLRDGCAWAGVGVFCLLLRYMIAGTLLPNYGEGVLRTGVGNGYLTRIFKAAGRCFLPPMEASGRMTLIFLSLCAVLAVLHVYIWKRRKDWQGFLSPYTRVVICWILAMAPPVAFGVSTRTSEGDRLLYFPSCFLCMALSGLLLLLVRDRKWQLLLIVAFIAGSVLFINGNNQRWVRASQVAHGILDTLKKEPAGRVFLVNAPDEWEGAFIYRNNLEHALTIHGIDTAKIVVNNSLLRLQYLGIDGDIPPIQKGAALFIYPDTEIRRADGHYRIVNLQTDSSRILDMQKDAVYYWDKSQLKRLNLNDWGLLP